MNLVQNWKYLCGNNFAQRSVRIILSIANVEFHSVCINYSNHSTEPKVNYLIIDEIFSIHSMCYRLSGTDNSVQDIWVHYDSVRGQFGTYCNIDVAL